MRTFFYYINKSDCATDCRWQNCPQRYLASLRKIDGMQDICPLFGEFTYNSRPLESTPRNGDIVILYAENLQVLDTIIAAKDGFDGLKKILVMADATGVDGDKYHRLAPRYITQAARNIDELESVLRKMKGHSN